MRDRDVRNAIHDALLEPAPLTGAVDLGPARGLRCRGVPACSSSHRARVERRGGSLGLGARRRLDRHQPGDAHVSRCNDDPQLRDEAVELLFDTAANWRRTARTSRASHCRSLAGFSPVLGETRGPGTENHQHVCLFLYCGRLERIR